MRKQSRNGEQAVRDDRFPPMLFGVYIGVLFLMSGIHMGLLVLFDKMQYGEMVQIIVPILYWAVVAIGLTLYTRWKIRSTYEEPMHQLAEAAQKVANGDFSVYIPPHHRSDNLDYLDVMILDFNKMVEELGSIETLKTDFVSNVSHEMKTPIAVIKNYAELLQMGNIDEEKRLEYAQSIEQAASRLSNLISNILKLNKLENQRMDLDMEVYDVCAQLCDSILQYEELWDEKEMDLEVDLEDRAYVYGDRSLLELVWNNLISNAIKFTNQGGRISICQESEEDYVRISVRDTGCGMDEESIHHIFDKFYQGDTSHAKEGNGLGLALAKRVIELMDGDIQVISRKGEGSTFTVTLPAAGKEETNEPH